MLNSTASSGAGSNLPKVPVVLHHRLSSPKASGLRGPSEGSLKLHVGADLDKGDHFQEIVHKEWLGEDGAIHLFDEIRDFAVSFVTGHEYKAAAEMGTHALHSEVKHIAGQSGHHHIAENDLEVAGHDLPDAFHAIANGLDVVKTGFKEFLNDIAKILVILQEQYSFGLHALNEIRNNTPV
jgi:hypothetical protein